MKRDPELERAILFALEKNPDRDLSTLEGYDEVTIGHHVWLMGNEGLLVVANTGVLDDPEPMAIAMHLTSTGHAAIRALHADTRWVRLKTTVLIRVAWMVAAAVLAALTAQVVAHLWRS